MPVSTLDLASPARRAALAIATVAVVAAAIATAVWSLGSSIAGRATLPSVADIADRLAPGDPQTHFAAGVLRQRTFNGDDAVAAAREFEIAAAIAPRNYLLWLRVGQTREVIGDRAGAEAALRQAAALAPAYSRVRWAYGNILLREDNDALAFEQMRAAAASDKTYAAPLVATANQIYRGDASAVRAAIGESPAVLSALAATLTAAGNFDAVVAIWRGFDERQRAEFSEGGRQIVAKLLDAKAFRLAAEMSNYVAGEPKYRLGAVYNGGFEIPLTARGADAFDWTVADGSEPQIAPTDERRRQGKYSLVLIFRRADAGGAAFRTVSQTIAAEPGAKYTLNGWYISELKDGTGVKLQIASAADRRVLATSPAITPAAEWTPIGIDFTVPDTADGVIVSVIRDACASAACAATGRIWFDDVELTSK